jgi:hypothetical protein
VFFIYRVPYFVSRRVEKIPTDASSTLTVAVAVAPEPPVTVTMHCPTVLPPSTVNTAPLPESVALVDASCAIKSAVGDAPGLGVAVGNGNGVGVATGVAVGAGVGTTQLIAAVKAVTPAWVTVNVFVDGCGALASNVRTAGVMLTAAIVGVGEGVGPFGAL